jgi:putative tryptophan/tyrosine transport system substrate-binding protein
MSRILAAVLCLAALPSPAETPAKPYRIGYLVTGGAVSFPLSVEPFKRGMRELGYREGVDYLLELRTAEGDVSRFPGLAAELMRLKVDVLVAATTPAAQAAKKATRAIPIVVANSADPVASGLAETLARPGGNVTGLSNLAADLGQKQLELLRGVLPKLSKVGVLIHPGNVTNKLIADDVQQAANALRIDLIRIEARNATDIESAFPRLAKEGAQALVVALEGLFVQQRRQLAELGLKHGMPTIFGQAEHADAGGLLSFGPDVSDNFRRAARYVDRILKGAKAATLPIEQPARFELVINLKTAGSLGLTIPPQIRFRADRLID